MSSSIVSRWVVRREHPVGDHDLDADGVLRDDAIEQWVHDARDAYLERCAVVQEMINGSKLVLRARGDLPGGAWFGRPATVVVSAGVTEVFPTSFTMAFRIRGFGQPGDSVVNATCGVSLEDPATGEPCELGNAVRDELIALEHAARHTN
jgi:acyl-CoA thioesterase FadM